MNDTIRRVVWNRVFRRLEDAVTGTRHFPEQLWKHNMNWRPLNLGLDVHVGRKTRHFSHCR